jgi:hypothetical protein
MGNRNDFSQTEILKHLADPNNKAACTMCGKTALDIKLDLHHKDGDPKNDSYKNIEILCEEHHTKLEGRDKKLSERR